MVPHQARCSVGVAVGLVTTTAATKGPLAQAERFADRAASSTVPRSGIEAVSQGQLRAVPGRLVGEQGPEQRPGAVGYRTSETGANQSRVAQLLEDQVTVGLGQSARVWMREGMPNLAESSGAP